jgi:signal transduction histidine kinase/ActR/RegA family two-component response regulator
VLADVLAQNTQAALAFQDESAAKQTLHALQAEPFVIDACLYNSNYAPFAEYHRGDQPTLAPTQPGEDGPRFESDSLVVVRPVVLNNRRIGTLYLETSLQGLHDRLKVFSELAFGILFFSVAVAFALSAWLQRPISQPILILTEAARRIAAENDFSFRVTPRWSGEAGQLTEAFNQLLKSIAERDSSLVMANDQLRKEIEVRKGAENRVQAQLGRLELLHRITRAVGERQDIQSIFQVVIETLEEQLPVSFCCVCSYNEKAKALSVSRVGGRSQKLKEELTQTEGSQVEIGNNGFSKCLAGGLIYEPDIGRSDFSFFKRLAGHGLRCVVVAPLLVESKVFGVVICARNEPDNFSSGECEFLRQLSEHVALATHQTQLYEALQRAYDDLQKTQLVVMQQERLRALGQMASGIAHDINNAISPIALYTDALLENEPGLSLRASGYLKTIQHAIEDIAQTVSRMKEFYRQRETPADFAPVEINELIEQVVNLSRARWNDIPQQRGVVLELHTNLARNIPLFLGVESEIREALVNLVFNAVDAMPEGGNLTLRTVALRQPNRVCVEVCDTGIGMSEEIQRRCFEPFFTTKGERGSGLGLAMVHGIARRNNAEIEIESKPAQGTTVRLIFPVPATPVLPAEAFKPSIALPSLRLLVVDDDPLLTKSLRDALESDGHQITTASGGQEGINLFRQAMERKEPFAVVITDLGMPHVNGRQLASEIKRMNASTPLILLTGWGQRLTAEDDIPENVDKVLNKPPKLRELREALANLIRTKKT